MSDVTPSTPRPERPVGAADGFSTGPQLRVRWWQGRTARVGAGLAITLGLFACQVVFPRSTLWRLHFTESGYLELNPHNIDLYVGLLLMPFMRKVSYRKRDILIITLVPIYGEYVAGKLVSRLLFLPRRDWLPRPEELPRVVRIPRAVDDYLLLPSFAEAEELRWRCRRPRTTAGRGRRTPPAGRRPEPPREA